MSERRRVLKFGDAVVLVPVNGERRGSSDNLSSPSLVTPQKSEKSSRLNTRIVGVSSFFATSEMTTHFNRTLKGELGKLPKVDILPMEYDTAG